jgi:hypothetical protein
MWVVGSAVRLVGWGFSGLAGACLVNGRYSLAVGALLAGVLLLVAVRIVREGSL